MNPMHVPPADPREVEALKRIAELEKKARSEARWSWATLFPQLVRLCGLLIIVFAGVALGIGLIEGQTPRGFVIQQVESVVVGIAIMVCATWAYRYAYLRAYGHIYPRG